MIKLLDILNEIKVNIPKYSLLYKVEDQVRKITNPKIIQAWIDYYDEVITGDELIKIIKQICTDFPEGFHKYLIDNISERPGLPASSSGSFLTGFYDFDQESMDPEGEIPEEKWDEINNKINRTRQHIVNHI